MAGLTATFVLYQWEVRSAESRFSENFQSDASVRVNLIEESVRDRLSEVEAIGRFFAGSQDVTPAEFRAFLQPILAERTGVSSVGWVSTSGSGEISLDILEPPDSNREFRPAALAAIQEAARSRGREETDQTFLVLLVPHGTKEQPLPVLLACRPTTQAPTEPKGIPRIGFVFAFIEARQVLNHAIGRTAPIGLHSWVYSTQRPGKRVLLTKWVPRLQTERSLAPGTNRYLEAVFEHSINIGGLSFLIVVRPNEAYLLKHERQLPLFIVPAGLMLTGLLTALVVVLVTQRQRAEALVAERTRDLSESEQRLRTIADFTSDWEYWVDERGDLEYVSPSVERLTGYTSQDIRKDQDLISRMVHPLDQEAFTEHMESYHRGPSARSQWYEWEFRIITASGSDRWISHICRPVTDAGGRYRGRRVSNRDITAWKLAEQSLRQHDRLYQAMFESNNAMKLLIRPSDGRIVDANPAAAEFYGYPREELKGRSILELSAWPDDEAGKALIAAGEKGQLGRHVPHRTASGEDKEVEIHSGPVEIRGQKLLFSIIHDVTDRKKAESDLRLAARVFESSHEAILITDQDTKIISVNEAFTEVTGYAAVDVIGKTPRVLASGRHDTEFYRRLWAALNRVGRWSGEIWNRRKNGEIYPEWLSISTVRDREGSVTNYVGISSDVSERKAAAERIEFLAHHDPLTGLLNRNLLRERLEQAISSARRADRLVALLFLDLDRFKNVNDSLGHLTGDRLLQEVAVRLKDCVRTSDTVCRQGGDEFLVILSDITLPDAASVVARKLLEQLARPYDIEGQNMVSTASAGISLFPADGQDFETLLRKADTALYHAKESGRNTYRFFSEAMNANLLERIELESLMRRSLERGEFRLYYQPQFDIRTGQIIGTEALLRWNTPEQGPIPPSRFIPIAEESGLILPLSEWVLFEACRQNGEWQREKLAAIPVAVNLSAVQFQRQNLQETVARALDFARLKPSYLELELTESILIRDALETIETLRNLKSMGVRLAIDDFGTGYSSLSYLRRFQVDKLKIDQSFVRDLSTDSDDSSIVRAIIQLGKGMRLKTIAEGVETAEQLQFLRDEECDEAQGYYFSRALPPDELVRLLKSLGVVS